VSGETRQQEQQRPPSLSGTEVAMETQERSREIQRIFGELLAAAQKLSYELATLDHKPSYSSEELRDLFAAAKDVVMATKKFHKFLERYARG
jgi:hypothetical protein